MRLTAALLLVILFFSPILGQKPDCHNLNPDCDGRGICMNQGNCRYFSRNSSYPFDCLTRANDEPKAGQLFQAVIIIACILNCSTFPFVAWRLLLEFRTRHNNADKSVISKVTKISLTCLFTVSLVTVLTSFDFFGIYQRLTGQEMIKKINVNFSGTLSMEDILRRITFLQRFRIPFAVSALSTIAGTYYIRETSSMKALQMAYNAIHVSIWCFFFIGLVVFSLRLLTILPPSVAPKIRRMTFILCFIISMCMFDKISSIVHYVYVNGRDGYLTGWRRMINLWLVWFTVIAMLELYMPVQKYKRWMRISALWHNTSSTSGGSSGVNNTGKSNSMDNSQIPMTVIDASS
ncbi:hypothetical protein PROFUN_12997 [Planoprotostelium fungivorum]|uniref:Transmembrane protein n=1 Tax=Planoprotostelium fungivorum TaxID=1890364 RepID=A0A2P6N620_9EUKA|nr:hypothetical protein PROFUN_12997 [Planoprotostelium fungivorum]